MRFVLSLRRGLPLLLAAVLLMTLSACSQKNSPDPSRTSQDAPASAADQAGLPDPTEAYAEAIGGLQRRLAGSRYRNYTETRMDISSAAGSYSTYASSNIQASFGDDFFMLAETIESAPNASQNTITFVDGYYVYLYEQGVTYRMDLDDQTKAQLLEQNTAAPLDLSGVAPSSQFIRPLDTGGYEVTLIFDAPSSDVLAKLLPSLRATVGDAAVSVKSLTVNAAVGEDGLLQAQNSEVQMELAADGRQTQITARISSTYTDIGGDFVISPPEVIDMAGAIPVDNVEAG